MSKVSRNLIANALGKILVAVSGLAFVPFYTKFLGLEAFAIVALVPSFSSLASIFDLGITPTINRELARLSAQSNAEAEMREVARSFEVIVWGVALLLGFLAAALVPLVLRRWSGTSGLSSETLRAAAYCTSLVLALQWPTGFYTGALLGLQNQVILSAVNALMAVVRGAGAVLLLWLISPTVEAFLLWQAFVSITLTLSFAALLWHSLPGSHRRARFSLAPIRRVWRLAAGMSGTGVMEIMSLQIDKFILSQVLPLEQFAYYMLGTTIASKFVLVLAPIIEAVFPRMTQLASVGHADALRSLYVSTVRLVAISILPAIPIFLWFGKDIIAVWTLDARYGDHSGLLSGVLVAGFAVVALVDVTMVLDWALGRAKVVFWSRSIGCIVLFPVLVTGGAYFGALGGAIAWAAVNGAVFFTTVPLIHWYWPAGRAAHWYFQSIVPPLGAALLAVWIWSLFNLDPTGYAQKIGTIALVTASAYAAAGMSSPISRDMLARLIRYLSARRSRAPNPYLE